MPAKQKVIEELEVTAQPKGVPDELGTSPMQDPGLSVDPEDLGRQFLSEATEQRNYESLRGGEAADMWTNSAAPSDEALPGPNFEGERTIWENSVSMAMENGGARGAHERIAPPRPDDDDDWQDDGMDAPKTGDIDLTDSVIQEASLLDHEAEELGETEAPNIQTEDGHSHGKQRGGHAPQKSRNKKHVTH